MLVKICMVRWKVQETLFPSEVIKPVILCFCSVVHWFSLILILLLVYTDFQWCNVNSTVHCQHSDWIRWISSLSYHSYRTHITLVTIIVTINVCLVLVALFLYPHGSYIQLSLTRKTLIPDWYINIICIICLVFLLMSRWDGLCLLLEGLSHILKMCCRSMLHTLQCNAYVVLCDVRMKPDITSFVQLKHLQATKVI